MYVTCMHTVCCSILLIWQLQMNTNIVLNNTPSIVGVRVPASMTREFRVLTGTDGDTDSLRKNETSQSQ